MDLQERLNHLEQLQNWTGLVDELERALVEESASATKAAAHLRLGRVLESKFLQSVRALKHFQEAFKLNPALVEALEEARRVYWALGRLNKVQQVLEFELKTAQDPAKIGELLVELGDVLSDEGDYERATATYARALGATEGKNELASELLEDVQCDTESWQDRVGELLRAAHGSTEAAEKARLFVRAARVARRFAPEAVEGMLAQAYRADHSEPAAAALYESLMAESNQLATLAQLQREMLDGLPSKARAEAALRFGRRWLARHQDAEVGAEMLAAALAANPDEVFAFGLLREVWGTNSGQWERVASFADELLQVATGQSRGLLLAEAGTLAWRELGNLIRARGYFELLSNIEPSHPELKAFELQIGESLGGSVPEVAEDPEVAVPALDNEAKGPDASIGDETSSDEASAQSEDPSGGDAEAVEQKPEVDEAKVAELRELAGKQEAAKRYNELVRTLVQLAGEVGEPAEKIDLFLRAADLYTTRFANQAEAIKVYEAILDIDPEHAQANDVLRQMYERRRDWEKLLGLQRREAERLDPGPQRAGMFLEMAKLATERVKKPDVCIELWRQVLASDPEHPDAIASLAFLFERTKDYESLVGILEKQVEIVYEAQQKVQLLSKLAMLQGDRLGDDEGAVSAWRALLSIEPNDRRAQEALKKKYLALRWWDELELFYVESGKWDELIRLLESQETKESEADVKISLLMKIASLWSERRQKSDRAARSYEKVLELDPNHLAAAGALAEIYASVGNFKGLAAANEVKLAHETDAWSRIGLLRELAEIYGERLKDPGAAFERYLAAFELAPSEEQCADDLEGAARLTDRWAEVTAVYRRAIEGGSEPSVGDLSLRLRLGRVFLEETGDIDSALVEFQAVYAADEDNSQAIAALERVYRETSRFEDLLGVYERRRELALDPDDRREISYSIAELYESKLNDPKRAILSYRSVLEDEPQDARALQALDALYRDEGDFEAYAEILRRRLELENDDAALVEIKFRLGQTLEAQLGNREAAVECYREILLLDQAHEGARGALESLLKDPELRREAALILEAVYELRGSWEQLVGAVSILADTETETAERVERRRKIARIASEFLVNQELAFQALAQALIDAPELDDLVDELTRLADEAKVWNELVAVFERIAANLAEADLAERYWFRLAGIDEQLGEIDRAANRLDQILAEQPENEEALLALDALYRRVERFGDVVGVYRRRIELAGEDASIREHLYAEMARVYEEKLGRPSEAIAAYREVLAADNASEMAIRALDGLFERQGMWVELADNLEAQLRFVSTEEVRRGLLLRLATLREKEMGQIPEAIEGFRQVIEEDATNEAALSALERLGGIAEHELAVAEILEPLYRQSGDCHKLIGVHEVQIRHADEAARKVDLLQEVARLYEDVAGNPSSAFDSLVRALRVEPLGEATQQELERLARATGRFGDLAKAYEDLAGGELEPTLASSLYSMSARIYRDELNDLDSAIGHYRQVLVTDPVSIEAAEALEELFRTAERYADLSAILQRKADIFDDAHDQKNALYQAAQIDEEILERKDSAISVYLKILDIDEEDIRSIDALIRLYLEMARWQELLDVYARKADLLADVFEKKDLLYQVGAVYERELGDRVKAIDTYSQVLELDPDDRAALGRLDVLYQATENWPELLSVLMHQQELCEDADESVALYYRIAELYERHMEDVPRAIELYREILMREPAHGPTLGALEALKDGDREPLSAASVLEPVYEAMGDWARLVSVLDVQQRLSDDPVSRVELLHRIARLQEDSLGNLEAAFGAYGRAFEFDCANEETLAALERLASVVGRWHEVARQYKAELDKLVDDPMQLVELGLRTAQIFEVQLADPDEAILLYRRVLAADNENYVAIRSLDRLLTMAERWGELVQVLAREAEMGETPDEILELKHRLGQVYELRLGDIDAAIASYREILAAAPEYERTLEALERLFAQGIRPSEIADILEPLYQAAGHWEKLAKVYEAQLDQLKGEERLAMYYRIAELIEERLLDAGAALDVYLRAVKEIPSEPRPSEEAERLAASVEAGWETLAHAYADVLTLHQAKEIQREIGGKLARVFEEELADATKAEETYRYVLTVHATDRQALSNLDRIYTAYEQWAELAVILEQRVQAVTEAYELVELYVRLGDTYESRLGQVDDAIRAYRRIFDELDPAHEDAIEALGRIYEAREAWQDLYGVYERKLENATGDVQEAEIRAKMAHMLADRLGDAARAIETWKRVLDLRGEDPEALRALANLYEAGEQWADLCDVLERELDIAYDDDARVAVLNRRARIFLKKLGRDDQALDDYERAVDVDFANLTALRAIASIWRERDDANELVQALERFVDRAAAMLEAEELRLIYRELGKTYGETLEQPYDAVEAWRKLLDLDPTDFEAMAALDELFRGLEEWPSVVEIKERRAEAFDDPAEKIRELLEVAALWRDPIEEPDQGCTAYEKILLIEPEHDGAFEALEGLHREAKRWESLIELYLGRLETRSDSSAKGSLLREIAKIFEEELDDKNQAFDALVNAFAEDYGDNETVRYLERIAQATNRWSELIQSANDWVKGESEAPKRIQLCLRLAKWYGEDLGHPDYAQPYYDQVLQLDPNNVAVLRQMANLHRKNAQWQAMGAALSRALEVASEEHDRKEILTDLGEVLDGHMRQPDQALGYFERALDIDPHHLPALEALERIYTSRQQYRELVPILTRKVEALVEGDRIASQKLRIAGLYEEELGEPELAIETYREVLDLDASSLPAMRGLERLYEKTQAWPDLISTLEMQLDVVSSERERIDALLKLAQIQENQFLKPDLAAPWLEQIVEIDPTQEVALVALARCYRKLRNWTSLVETYERHVAYAADRQTRVELYGQIAAVFEEIDDLDRAIDAYRNVVDLDEANVEALEALAKLYEKQDDSMQAIDCMKRVAELTSDTRQRVDMYFRIGKALDEKLGDRAEAEESFEMALDLDPAHLPTLSALRQIAMDSADWHRAARYLYQEQAHTLLPRQRAKLLVDLGQVREDMLGDHASAMEAYQLALQCDADNEDAAQPVLVEYVRTEKWDMAEPLADMLVRKASRREREEEHRLWFMAGQVASALGKDEKALKAFGEAHKVDLTDLPTIRALAEVSFRMKDWAGALTNYQKVLTSLDEFDTEARAEVYFRLGCIKREQGQLKQGVGHFEKALGIDASHRPSLDALVDIYTELSDFAQVCSYKRQILDDVLDGKKRLAMLVEIGDIWANQGKSTEKAIEALEEALDLDPQNHVVLHKLLKLYQQSSSWEKLVDTVRAIADLETNPERKSKYVYTIAQIYRDKLEDLDSAVEHFNETLDLNPSYLEAFERINKILNQSRDWKQLERAFRKMLLRIRGKGNTELEHNLWHSLGIIYRDRLNEMQPAVEAFRMAAQVKPDDLFGRQILAELYENSGQTDRAITEQQEILRRDPMRVEPYRALYRLYLDQEGFDKAWCIAAALSFLGKATPEERAFFEQHRPQGMLQVKARLDNEQWGRNLFYQPEENLYIGKILEMLAPAALTAKIFQLRASRQLPALDKRFRQDPATSTVTFAKTFGWAATVLGVNVPELYVRNDVTSGLSAIPATPPASLAGQQVLTGHTPQELTFICGKHLSSYRGEHYLKNLFPTVPELTMLLFAGVKMVDPSRPTPPELATQVNATATELAKYMQPVNIEGLRLVVKRFVEDGARANVRRFSQAVELTGIRAGFLLAGDLDIARRVIASEPQVPGDLSPAEKMKELIVFSVSDQYFALRRALGIAIG